MGEAGPLVQAEPVDATLERGSPKEAIAWLKQLFVDENQYLQLPAMLAMHAGVSLSQMHAALYSTLDEVD